MIERNSSDNKFLSKWHFATDDSGTKISKIILKYISHNYIKSSIYTVYTNSVFGVFLSLFSKCNLSKIQFLK